MLLLRFVFDSSVQHYHTARSSHQAQYVFMKACATLGTSIVPAATKPDMKPPPQIPSGPLLPLQPSLTGMGEERWKVARQKTFNQDTKDDRRKPPPPSPASAGRARGPLSGYRARTCQLKETHLTGGHPRELICQGSYLRARVSRHLMGACLCVYMCVCVWGVLMCLLVINEYIKCHHAIYSIQTYQLNANGVKTEGEDRVGVAVHQIQI